MSYGSKIPGRVLLGFSDFFDDEAYVGTATPTKTPLKPIVTKKGPPPKPTTTLKPGTATLYGKTVATKPNQAVQVHAAVLAKGHAAAAKAVQSALNASKAARRVVKPVAVGQDGGIYLGQDIYIGAVTRTLTPKQKAAVSKSQAASAKSAKLATSTQKAAVSARNAASTLAKKMIAQKAVSLSLRKKTAGATRIHGAVLGGNVEIGNLIGTIQDQVFGDFYAAIGAYPHPEYPGYLTDGATDPAYFVGSIGADANGLSPGQPGYDPTTDPSATTTPTATTATPDPNNPGFLTDGSIDPNATGATDPTSATTTSAASNPLDTGNLPPPPPISQPISDLTQLGAIMYDGSRGKPIGFIGSLNYFSGTATADSMNTASKVAAAMFNPLLFLQKNDLYGYVWGGDPNNGDWPGNDPNQWVEIHGHHGGTDWWDNIGGWDQTGAIAQKSAGQTVPGTSVPYGPIVGNPSASFQGGAFANMRVDFQGNCGWLPQEAPDWATFPLKQAAALTAKAATDAANQAAAADAAAQAKMQADAAAAQAAQDAQNQLAETQSTSDANVAQTQAETQAQQVLVQQAQQQADSDKAAQDQQLQQAQQQAQLDQQYQQQQMQMQQQAAQMQMQYAQQQVQSGYPPDGSMAPMDYSDQGGDLSFDPSYGSAQDGFADDGSNAMPGDPNFDPFADDGSNAMSDDQNYDPFAQG